MNKELDKISVIVPIYNAEKYLDRCLSSIIGQTYKNLEIICVDDGSTDNSLAICNKYSLLDNRIKVVNKSNGGVTSARKAGMKIASGEWVGFVDSDDWLELYAYERMIKKGENEDVTLICGNFRRNYENHSIDYISKFNEGKYELSEDNSYFISNFIFNKEIFEFGIYPSLWNKLFRRKNVEIILNELDEDIIFQEDAAIVYSYILKYKKIYVINDIVYNYNRYNSDSCMHCFNNEKYNSIIKAYSFIKELETNENKEYIDKQLLWLKLYYTLLYLPEKMEIKEKKKILCYLGDINKDDNIVLYGAGIMGQRYYDYLSNIGVKISLWVDKEKKEYNGENKICSIDKIRCVEYDKIVIAVIKHDIVKSIVDELAGMGIDRNKIYYIDGSEISEKINKLKV